jgi:SAM-dependent methyltransferase
MESEQGVVMGQAGGIAAERPWQLRMFDTSLKKKLKFAHLRQHLGDVQGQRCLLLTCGDNNGALNYLFSELGGTWSWADVEDRSIPEMERFLGASVAHVAPERLIYGDGSFDKIIVIDTHEHLPDPEPFNRELARVLAPGGRLVVTVPNGDSAKPAILLKNLVGMTKESYGHCRWGYNRRQLSALLQGVGLNVISTSSYSRFFTETLELALNVAYVKLLAPKSKAPVQAGVIAPATRDQVKSVEKPIKMYARIYPLVWAVSQLDRLLVWDSGYCVVAAAEKGR